MKSATCLPATFEAALRAVLIHEGGFVDHPLDPGGATMKGVTFRVYNAWRERQGLPVRSVKQIELWELTSIYRQLYADKIAFEQLPAGVAYAVFDGAVNSGPAQAAKWLQRALGVRADGVIGPATLAAAEAHPDHDELIAAMLKLRLAFMQALKTWNTFGKGWTRRLAGVRKLGQEWASGSVGEMPVYCPGGEHKARAQDAKAPPSAAPGDVATGTGLATSGLGEAVRQAQDTLTPLAGTSPWIGNVVAALVIMGVLLTMGGLAWRFWTARKAAQRAQALDLDDMPDWPVDAEQQPFLSAAIVAAADGERR